MNSYLPDEEDEECPLCLDTLDISDLNFKPCPCGYSICRFCWHHIKENLNGRCPACRKPYDDAAIEFKPMKPEELKRLQAAKKQREKEKKDADVMSKRHAANVRVKQRAQVHIQGMTTKIANEDTLPALKGPDQFGRFGKIIKLFFSRRAHPPPNGPGVLTPSLPSSSSLYTPVNVYINYSHPSEAHACIAAIDGTVTPDGHKLKAIWGTTRYCPAYLRGVKCTNDNCMQAHEPGEEIESHTHPGSSYHGGPSYGHGPSGHGHHTNSSNAYMQQAANAASTSREEMVNLKHAWKEQGGSSSAMNNQASNSNTERPALPATASWASKAPANSHTAADSTPRPLSAASSAAAHAHNHSSSISSRLPKAQNHPLPPRPSSSSTAPTQETPNKRSSTATPSAESRDKTASSGDRAIPHSTSKNATTDSAGAGSTSKSSSTAIVAPPTPPTSEPSSSTASLVLPPGLPISALVGSESSTPGRPITPVSEFDRTLGNLGFGGGMSFNFNLSSSPSSGKGKERSPLSSLEDGTDDNTASQASGAVSSSNVTSRSVSPDFLASLKSRTDVLFNPLGGDPLDDPSTRYAHFDPFSAGADASTPTPAADNGKDAPTNPPAAAKVEGPPGLSRVNTTASSQDSTASGSGSSSGVAGLSSGIKAPPGLPLPPAIDDAAARGKSRFGFARAGSSSGSLPPGFGVTPGTGISLPVSELFKGVSGPLGLNGGSSPIRPSSATSSGSGNLGGLSLPPGVFSSSSLPASSLPSAITSSSELPLPPLSSSKSGSQTSSGNKANDLSDLFPGVDLAASFSSGSSLPPSLIKSLGISLENVDMNASSSNGKLPNFAPMPLGTGSSIANQPLPPPSSSGLVSSNSASGSNAGQGGASGSSVTSGHPPPGFGSTRQAQQAHAQHAQQAHQAQLAAQQAAAAATASQQAQGQGSTAGGRPPSAASVGSGGTSAGKAQQSEVYSQYMGLQNAQSPPLPATPGQFNGDAQRFQDPAIISYAGMNGFGHHLPYGHPNAYHQHGPGGPHDLGQQPQAEYYNRYHPLPTPVQPQQTYNPYVPVAPVGLNGMGRVQGQTLSQNGAFGLLRR